MIPQNQKPPFRPLVLDQLEFRNPNSKPNTGRSAQGSLHEYDSNSGIFSRIKMSKNFCSKYAWVIFGVLENKEK